MCVWKEGVAFICVQYAACVHLSLSLRVSKSTKEMKKSLNKMNIRMQEIRQQKFSASSHVALMCTCV